MRTSLLFFIFATVFHMIGLTGLSAQDNVVDQVVWIVGDEAIFKSQVEEARLQAQLQGQRWHGDPYCIIPEELAIRKLYLNQADIDSVYATPAEINQQIDYRLQTLATNVGGVEKVEEYYEMSVSQIRDRLSESVREEIVVSKMRSRVTSNVKVTPAEVRRYYKNVDIDSIPFVPTQVEVQIITLEPVIPQSEIESVKAELRDYTERIQSGTTQFSTLALLYSQDTGSARRGGEIGFTGRGELLPEFAAVAFNLTDPQKVSKIVETEAGFHIIQLIEKRGDRVNVRHILKKPEVSEESIKASIARLDSISDDIRMSKFSFEEGARYISADKDTRNNNGLMIYHLPNENTSVSKFEMQQLPQDVAKVVDNMNVGEISKPFTMIADNGKQVCAIVKLKTRITGHKATISDDYQILLDNVLALKSDEAEREWIKKKQLSTYVKIMEGWSDCEFRYPGWVK